MENNVYHLAAYGSSPISISISSSGSHHPPSLPPPPNSYNVSAPDIDLTIPRLFAFVLCFFFFSLVYSFAFNLPSSSSLEDLERRHANKKVVRGLHPTMLASFLVVPYAEAGGDGERMVGRECTVCLIEFSSDDAIRVLPTCGHGFHTECIDRWLVGHTTCPLCRYDLGVMNDKEVEGDNTSNYVIDIPGEA